MWYLCGVLLFVVARPGGHLLNFLAAKTAWLNRICLEATPTSELAAYYDGIVCGTSLPSDLASDLRTTGLYHLMVVSGAHLIFLEQGLQVAFKKHPRLNLIVTPLVLVLFTGMTQLGAPVVRALVHWLYKRWDQKVHLGFAQHELTHLSGVTTLALFPEYITSFSLQLSWLASLVMGANWSLLQKQLALYVLLLPLLFVFSLPHPFVILTNLILAPALGFILFPISLIACAIPITALSDGLWTIFIELNATLANAIFPLSAPELNAISGPWAWVYIGVIHFCLAIYRRLWGHD